MSEEMKFAISKDMIDLMMYCIQREVNRLEGIKFNVMTGIYECYLLCGLSKEAGISRYYNDLEVANKSLLWLKSLRKFLCDNKEKEKNDE
jgi:hypothetical protein